MSGGIKVLFAGEAIYTLQTIYKGRNSFSMGRYFEHGRVLCQSPGGE